LFNTDRFAPEEDSIYYDQGGQNSQVHYLVPCSYEIVQKLHFGILPQ